LEGPRESKRPRSYCERLIVLIFPSSPVCRPRPGTPPRSCARN
jgi:hypothetical protein